MRADVANMILYPGFYLLGDVRNPAANVPIISDGGTLQSMRGDQFLDPERVLHSAVIQGPYLIVIPPPPFDPVSVNRDRDLWTSDAMEADDGSFVKALGILARRADPHNLAKIKATWPEAWKQYEALGIEAESERNRGCGD